MAGASGELAGRIALVTGASSGLGRRFAQTLASAGADVAIAARRVDRLEEVAKEVRAHGVKCLPIALDVSNAEQIVAAVEEVSTELGTIDILVNNAGMPDAQRAHKMSLELVDQVLATNLRGPWLLSTEVARRLIAEKKPGRIINLSSATSFNYDGHGAALYSVTKAAINRMTEVLAVEWARNFINVNAIAPGAFNSEMMSGMLERMGDLSQGFPRKRMGEAHQLDSTLLYLASPASEFVTGTVIKVDDAQGPR